jgi:hypothetical protein
MALGELVGEGRGKITTMRVLPDGKMEVSQQGTGKLLGSEISDAATYWTVMRPNGTAYGEGQQAIMSGDGSAVWKGSGVGKPTIGQGGGGGGWKYGVVGTFQTIASQRWGRLFDVCTVEEYEVDQNQNYHWKMWEWKY